MNFTIDLDTCKKTLVSTRFIKKDEEITMSYISFGLRNVDTQTRLSMLKQQYEFWCNCDSCKH